MHARTLVWGFRVLAMDARTLVCGFRVLAMGALSYGGLGCWPWVHALSCGGLECWVLGAGQVALDAGCAHALSCGGGQWGRGCTGDGAMLATDARSCGQGADAGGGGGQGGLGAVRLLMHTCPCW